MAEVALTAREEKKKELIWSVLVNNGAEVVLFPHI